MLGILLGLVVVVDVVLFPVEGVVVVAMVVVPIGVFVIEVGDVVVFDKIR